MFPLFSFPQGAKNFITDLKLNILVYSVQIKVFVT